MAVHACRYEAISLHGKVLECIKVFSARCERSSSSLWWAHLTGLRDVHEIAATRVKYTLAIRLQSRAPLSIISGCKVPDEHPILQP